jgi:hypothetical protein
VWKGDTLVVDTTGFNDKVWLSFNGPFSGLPQTEAMHIVERAAAPHSARIADSDVRRGVQSRCTPRIVKSL